MTSYNITRIYENGKLISFPDFDKLTQYRSMFNLFTTTYHDRELRLIEISRNISLMYDPKYKRQFVVFSGENENKVSKTQYDFFMSYLMNDKWFNFCKRYRYIYDEYYNVFGKPRCAIGRYTDEMANRDISLKKNLKFYIISYPVPSNIRSTIKSGTLAAVLDKELRLMSVLDTDYYILYNSNTKRHCGIYYDYFEGIFYTNFKNDDYYSSLDIVTNDKLFNERLWLCKERKYLDDIRDKYDPHLLYKKKYGIM